MTDLNIRSLTIVGGGSAGWMTAAALSNILGDHCRITLIESETIGIVGVGEATIPPIKIFNQRLGIDEATFVKKTQATFKLGIEFVNWGQQGDRYFHPFGTYGADFDTVPLHYYWVREHKDGYTRPLQDHCMAWGLAQKNRFSPPTKDPRNALSTFDYAYHFDATLYGQFLREYSEAKGVERIEGRVVDVKLTPETGFIESITLDSERIVESDFFIDCTGFAGLLIEDSLKTGYTEWTQWLPCDRAQAIPSAHAEELRPYTRATAHDAGWQWSIPLQHRMGNGYVYSSHYTDDSDATETLLSHIEGDLLASSPRLLKFTTGHRKKFWHKNCVAIGLSAGFLEPLESTSLHLIQSGIMRLAALFPDKSFSRSIIDEYNRLTQQEYERVRDFIILHYKATTRSDAPLWEYTQHMDIPDTLKHRMELFQEHGHISAYDGELFRNPSWLAVYIGQNIIPEHNMPIASARQHVDARKHLEGLASVISQASNAQPHHQDFIQQHCPAPKI